MHSDWLDGLTSIALRSNSFRILSSEREKGGWEYSGMTDRQTIPTLYGILTHEITVHRPMWNQRTFRHEKCTIRYLLACQQIHKLSNHFKGIVSLGS